MIGPTRLKMIMSGPCLHQWKFADLSVSASKGVLTPYEIDHSLQDDILAVDADLADATSCDGA